MYSLPGGDIRMMYQSVHKLCRICVEVFKLQENKPTPSASTSLQLTVLTNLMDDYFKRDLHLTCFPTSTCYLLILVYFPMYSNYEPAPPSFQKERINLTSPSCSRDPRTKRTANKPSLPLFTISTVHGTTMPGEYTTAVQSTV